LSDRKFDNEDLAVGDVLDRPRVRGLAPPPFPTTRARVRFRSAAPLLHADVRLYDVHACVPPGLVSQLPGRHRLPFSTRSIRPMTKLQSPSARSVEKRQGCEPAERPEEAAATAQQFGSFPA